MPVAANTTELLAEGGRGGHSPGTRQWWWALWLMLVLVSFSVLALSLPPLQSPDEPDHVRRAYLVGHGDFLLESPEGQMSGGWIDSALNHYLTEYHKLGLPEHRERRLAEDERAALAAIDWAGDRTVYVIVPGTGYYFPAIYLPQAVGLRLGELMQLSIENSYRLARLSAFLASLAMAIAAIRYCRMPPGVAALLLLPVSVLQGVSASIDGVANGLVLLVVAIFIVLWRGAPAQRHPALVGLCAAIFLVVTCRYHLAGLLILPFLVAWRWRSASGAVLGGATVVATLAWTGWSLASTVDHRVAHMAPASEIIWYYIKQPLEFAKVFYRSWAEPELHWLYYESFIGRLGALDVRFSPQQYGWMAVLLVLAIVFSIDVRRWYDDWPVRAALAFCALAAIPLAFFAMLIGWTPHPAYVVYGVQGRYFIAPAIMLVYAVASIETRGSARTATGPQTELPIGMPVLAGWACAVALAAYSFWTVPGMLHERVYIGP